MEDKIAKDCTKAQSAAAAPLSEEQQTEPKKSSSIESTNLCLGDVDPSLSKHELVADIVLTGMSAREFWERCPRPNIQSCWKDLLANIADED